ncbi:hypothetical protein [Williamsia sp. DF01-3]|uniref:hypothetical protein n=1 Tax=Williamsia sp. DF01-3 TaxID=2934157 RepID=UPI001FF6284E|nr:hypothetical protein [Williamsia sp. DF01-3]MCK0516785.1 hypothetical protein [Williamsia sp. DF01-3]
MARLRFVSALTDLTAGFGLPDRAIRRPRILGLFGQRPEVGLALTSVHSGPWSVEAEAYSPDILRDARAHVAVLLLGIEVLSRTAVRDSRPNVLRSIETDML